MFEPTRISLAVRRLIPSAFVVVLCVLGCQSNEPQVDESSTKGPAAAETRQVEAPLFVDAGPGSGFDFVHFNGMSGKFFFNEMVGPGAALLDYDNDGDLDIFVVQGTMLPAGAEISQALFPPHHAEPFSDRLYRNDLSSEASEASEATGLRFTDVTGPSGLATLAATEGSERGYGMGVATGDIDNDGFMDLYITRLGSNQLLHNQGDGTFRDITSASSADDRHWSVSATFLDYDRDGWLDLFIGNYVDFSLASNKQCRAATGSPDYCGPLSYSSQPDRLLHNRGDGTFEDVTQRSGVGAEFGGALGVVAADLNLDGWMDLYVANDGVANQMWLNQGDGTFANEAVFAGSALNREGHPEAGMGVDAGDFDNDGDEDLFLAHLSKETNTLYRNSGQAQFQDATLTTGLANASWEATGFGTVFLDYDNDGWLDILVLNGAVKVLEELTRRGDPYPLHQRNQLFRNLANGSFQETTDAAGESFAPSRVSRGAAVGDLDNDGDLDLVLANNNAAARLLENHAAAGHHWLGVSLRDAGGRDMLGAWVELERSTPPQLWRRAGSGGSYASAQDPRVLFGLGAGTEVQALRVQWPSGRWERFAVDGVDRYMTVQQGRGESLDAGGRDE